MTTLSDSNSPAGTNEAPNSPSSAGNVQPGSETGTYTKAEFEALKARLDRVERAAQGDKDRAVKRTNERIEGLEERLRPMLEQAQKYIAKGHSVDAAIEQVQSDNDRAETEAAIREMAKAWKSGQLPNSPAGNRQSEGVNVTEVLEDLGLDPNDLAVKVAFEGKQFASLEEAELAAAKLLRAKKQQPNPTQAQMPSRPAQPVTSPGAQQLTEAYTKEMRGLVGKVNAKARDAVKEKYQKLGVDIYSVDFTT